MRKPRWAVAALLSVALVSAACGSDDEPAIETGGGGDRDKVEVPEFDEGTTMAALQEKGKITIGTKFDQPLFGFKNPVTNEVEGFDVEIGKLVALAIFGGDLEGIDGKVEFVEAVSKNREPFIQQGTVDIVVATYTINDARKQVVDFAGPYFVADQDVMVREDEATIKGVADLEGKKVCSATGSTSLKNIQAQAPKADYSITFDRYSLCAEALADGRVNAVTTDNAILAGLVNDNPGKFKLLGADLSDEPYGIGLKKGDDAFRDFLNDRLETIFDNGQWAKAFEATVGKVINPTPEPPKLDRYESGGATPTTAAATTTTG